MTLGRYPSVQPDSARKHAASVKADATLRGTDQARDRKATARALKVAQRQARDARTRTVALLTERYLAEAERRVRASTLALYRGLLTRHILPALGTAVAAELRTADVARLHCAMAATPTTANQCLRLLSTLCRYAERIGERPKGSNPATDVPRYRETLLERYLQPHELSALLRALDTAATSGLPAAPWRLRTVDPKHAKHAPPPKPDKKNIARGTPVPANPIAIAALRLLGLTGARKAEVLSLRWTDVDVSRAVLTLTDTKTGRSVRPLSPPALEVLRTVPRLGVSPFVFASPGNPAQPIRDLSRLWDAVRHAAGLDTVRLHDLRHTAASLMLQSGATLAEVARAIGHTSARTTQRYAAIADTGAQRAAELLGTAVTKAGTQAPTVSRPLRARHT